MNVSVKDFEIKCAYNTIKGKIFGDTAKKSPAIIMSHGFMADYTMCSGYAEAMAAKGYIAIAFDFCGGGLSSRSTGATTEMSVVTESEELCTVYEYICSLEYIDRDNISLLGCSQGGFVSARVAKRLGMEKVKNLILFYPALCIPEDARKGAMIDARFDPKNLPEIISCGPMNIGKRYVLDVINMDAYQEIEGYNGNVLLVHGTKDDIVDIEYARKAKNVYKNCEYHELEGAGHVYFNQYYDESVKLLTDFMAKN